MKYYNIENINKQTTYNFILIKRSDRKHTQKNVTKHKTECEVKKLDY